MSGLVTVAQAPKLPQLPPLRVAVWRSSSRELVSMPARSSTPSAVETLTVPVVL